MSQVLKKNTTNARKVELTTLLDLELRIDGVMAFLTPDTVLLKEGPITEIDPRNKQISIRTLNRLETVHHLFLFNRFLLICTPIDGSKRHSIIGKFQLSSVQVYDCDNLISKECDSTLWCVLQTPNKAIYIRFGSVEESKEWKMVIKQACVEAETRKSFKRTESSCSDFTRAPVWVPDDSADACMLCSNKFSVVRRRHHCRGCGILICVKCCGGKLRLPYEKMSMNIVCNKCFCRASKFARHLLPIDDVTLETEPDEEKIVFTLTPSQVFTGSNKLFLSQEI